MGADRSALTALGVVAVVLVALLATSSGGLRPVHVLTSSSQNAGPPPRHQSSSGRAPHSGGGAQQQSSPSAPTRGLPWLLTWSQLLLLVVLALIALTVIVGLRVAFIRQRKLPPARVRAVTPLVEDQAPAEPLESLESMLGGQLAALDAGTPRNAIVAAWVQLEEYATSHGLPREPADTPAEFVARALAAYDLDSAAIERLADLYREARFSTHPMEERHRQEARVCLERLTTTGASL